MAKSDSLTIQRLEVERFQAILDTARDAVVGIDGGGNLVLFNRAAEDMFGHAAADVLGREVGLLMPPPYREEHDGYIRRYRETGEARAIGRIREVTGLRKNGETFPIEIAVSEARVGDEVVFAAIIRDLTERRRLDARLARRARQQEAIAALAHHALRGDVARMLEEATEAVAAVLGADHCKVLELLPEGDRLVLRAGVGWAPGSVGKATVEAGASSQAGYTLADARAVVVEDLRHEARFQAADLLRDHGVRSGVSVVIQGLERPYGVLGAHCSEPRRWSEHDVAFVETVADLLSMVIELRQAEEASRRRQQLVEIGVLSAHVAHDLGNPLAGLGMLAERMARRLDSDPTQPIETVRQSITQISETARRMQGLIQSFKDFAREQRLDLETIDLPHFLAELRAAWEAPASDRAITLEIDSVAPVAITADRDKLWRVFDNLIKNAIEAVDSGPGRVVIAAAPAEDASRVRITVTDTGPGVPIERDVFALFETSKPRGLGLGLALAREVVLAHGGAIAFDTAEPQGARFQVELPVRGPRSITGRS